LSSGGGALWLNIRTWESQACLCKYSISSRSLFPNTLDADVLRKLGFAPGNESLILNTIRFIRLIDEKGGRTEKAQKTFTLHDAGSFAKAFAELVKAAYSDLFKLHGDDAWTLSNAKLITYFRQADQSSELVGTRQANTFRTLATYALIKLNSCGTVSEKDEQKGFQFLFAGSMLAIRNPRGHEYAIDDSPDECLDHLGLVSLLIRRVQAAGHKIPGR